jgi:hypothetical protein
MQKKLVWFLWEEWSTTRRILKRLRLNEKQAQRVDIARTKSFVGPGLAKLLHITVEKLVCPCSMRRRGLFRNRTFHPDVNFFLSFFTPKTVSAACQLALVMLGTPVHQSAPLISPSQPVSALSVTPLTPSLPLSLRHQSMPGV